MHWPNATVACIAVYKNMKETKHIERVKKHAVTMFVI